MARVKICGIRREQDAQLAARYGADAVGVLVGQRHASPDFVEPDLAASILDSVPPFVTTVLVTHAPLPDEVIELARRCRASAVQIHSSMPASGIAEVRKALPALKLIRCLHVAGEDSFREASELEECVDAFLLDSANAATGQVGGTGLTHDWELSRHFAANSRKPVILAGGLKAENVAAAIRQVRPFAVDVNSGTKAADGFKDEARLRAFIEQARRA